MKTALMKLVPLLAALTISTNVWAYDPVHAPVTGHEVPAEFKDIGVTEHLGGQIDLSNTFTDEDGKTVALGQYFHKDRPVLMAMVYYNCPGLCNFHLNGLTEIMKGMKWTTGSEFEVVAVSMDVRETPDVAKKKKENYLKEYARPQGNAGWHFLVGNKANVAKLADELGFHYRWVEEKKQFAHASVAYAVTPGGKISRYLQGISPDPATFKLSLIEASNGKIGTVVDHLMMFCFQFDPKKNKYTLYAWNLMRIGAILMVLLLAVIMIPLWFRGHEEHKPSS